MKITLSLITLIWGGESAFAQPQGMTMGIKKERRHEQFYTKVGNRKIYHLYINDTIYQFPAKIWGSRTPHHLQAALLVPLMSHPVIL
jgi:hypothetical protein